MLPPESLPRPSGDPPAAMIAASPLLLTPGERLMSYGLRVPLCRGLQLFSPWIGGQFVLPIKIAPARRIRATTVASWSGMRLRRMRRPAVVGRPAVLKMSLTVNGTPCSGPSALPRVLWRSAGWAFLVAPSAVPENPTLRGGGSGGGWAPSAPPPPTPGKVFWPGSRPAPTRSPRGSSAPPDGSATAALSVCHIAPPASPPQKTIPPLSVMPHDCSA